MRRAWLLAVVCVCAPARLSAQTDLRALAATAASAWTAHDFARVVGAGRVEVRISGVSAAGPLPSDQAVAVLVNHVRGAEEVEVTVVTVLAVSELSGYAELRRWFRPVGVGGSQEETVLLGFTRAKGAGGNLGPWGVGVVEVVGRSGR